MRAEAARDSGPWRQQAILGRGRWDAHALRKIVRECALETLAEETAVLRPLLLVAAIASPVRSGERERAR